ncbi:MAG: hypothetical protein EZS28_005328 [Streblomastix strix]|uniref:Transcription factor IIIC subunit 5 HTH domain-containing protein n=1 Tax=Streblomastix strix TaxID=222440 RepID=A0A5J4WVW3_9EUKA|nr:MAG: hypothetical protein EZS28_005328 [Streblomastix strix]
MPPLNDSVLKKIIHNCAYNFSSGPWSRAWVRLGYDPRKDKTSRIFQILRIRLKYNQIQKVKKRAINYHTVSVQICDIPDSSFQAIARFSPFPSKCRSVDGWFFESSINDLRNRAHPIITQLYKNINEVAKTSDKILDNGTISKRSAFQIAHASNKALPLEFKKHIPQHLQVLRNDSQGRQAEQQNFGTDVMQEAGTDSESAIIREQEDEQNI